MDWREYASKMIVLIADAPPHGIGEYGDGEFSWTWVSFFLFLALGLLLGWFCGMIWIGFDDGSPDGFDPLQIVREMATKGITLVCAPVESVVEWHLS